MRQEKTNLQKALNLWSVILIVWAIYRAKLRMPVWFDELVAKPLVFVLPVFWYILKKEKKNLLNGLDFRPKKIISDLFTGLIIGFFVILIPILIHFLKTKQVVFPNLNQLPILVFLGLATATSEEILSRGFILKRLYEDSKNKLSASFFASVLFFFLHIPIVFTNPQLTGNLLLTVLAVNLAFGFINSLIFLDYGLFLSILIHLFYNLSLSLMI